MSMIVYRILFGWVRYWPMCPSAPIWGCSGGGQADDRRALGVCIWSREPLPRLAYVATTAAAVVTGFWDRHCRPTCGRLHRVLLRVDFSELSIPEGTLRKKASVTAYWPTGVQGRRQDRLTRPAHSLRRWKVA
jgi:hypothetical protein